MTGVQTCALPIYAYQAADGDVNYAVRKFDGYGKLSGKSLDVFLKGRLIDPLGMTESLVLRERYLNGIVPLTANRTTGIASLLPGGTVFQSDVAAKGRLLASQIAWTPAKARWNKCNLTVSLSDAQFLMALEEGGDVQQGRITVLVEKLQFGARGFPGYGNTFEIQAAGRWHQFTVAEMLGQHDDNEPGLTLFLEKDQNELGD